MDFRLYSIDDAAAALGISRSYLQQLIRSGRLETVRLGERDRIPSAALEGFVQGLVRKEVKGSLGAAKARVPA